MADQTPTRGGYPSTPTPVTEFPPPTAGTTSDARDDLGNSVDDALTAVREALAYLAESQIPDPGRARDCLDAARYALEDVQAAIGDQPVADGTPAGELRAASSLRYRLANALYAWTRGQAGLPEGPPDDDDVYWDNALGRADVVLAVLADGASPIDPGDLARMLSAADVVRRETSAEWRGLLADNLVRLAAAYQETDAHRCAQADRIRELTAERDRLRGLLLKLAPAARARLESLDMLIGVPHELGGDARPEAEEDDPEPDPARELAEDIVFDQARTIDHAAALKRIADRYPDLTTEEAERLADQIDELIETSDLTIAWDGLDAAEAPNA